MMTSIHLIFLSDTHLGFDYPLRPGAGIAHRGEDFFRNFQTVLNYARGVRADLVVHGGDLFFRSRVPGAIIDRTYRLLTEFARSHIPFFVVPGNHERSQLPQPLLLRHPSLYIFNRPRTYSIRCGRTMIFVSGFPYERNSIRCNFIRILRAAGWEKSGRGLRLLCLHQLIEGAVAGPKNFQFKGGSDVIRRADLPHNAQAILAGHVHRRQELSVQTSRYDPLPVFFAGSTERTSFAEKDEQKGFYHLIFHLCPSRGWRIRHKLFIPLPARPMIDFMIDRFRSMGEIEAALKRDFPYSGGNAIIRINTQRILSAEIRSCLRAEWFRQRLPASAQFVLSKQIFT